MLSTQIQYTYPPRQRRSYRGTAPRADTGRFVPSQCKTHSICHSRVLPPQICSTTCPPLVYHSIFATFPSEPPTKRMYAPLSSERTINSSTSSTFGIVAGGPIGPLSPSGPRRREEGRTRRLGVVAGHQREHEERAGAGRRPSTRSLSLPVVQSDCQRGLRSQSLTSSSATAPRVTGWVSASWHRGRCWAWGGASLRIVTLGCFVAQCRSEGETRQSSVRFPPTRPPPPAVRGACRARWPSG